MKSKLFIIPLLALTLSACSSEASEEKGLVRSLDVINLKDGDEILVERSIRLNWEIDVAEGASEDVLFSTSDDSIASINEFGVVEPHKEGDVEIKVSSIADPTVRLQSVCDSRCWS